MKVDLHVFDGDDFVLRHRHPSVQQTEDVLLETRLEVLVGPFPPTATPNDIRQLGRESDVAGPASDNKDGISSGRIHMGRYRRAGRYSTVLGRATAASAKCRPGG